jgi:hypothetical protein
VVLTRSDDGVISCSPQGFEFFGLKRRLCAAQGFDSLELLSVFLGHLPVSSALNTLVALV